MLAVNAQEADIINMKYLLLGVMFLGIPYFLLTTMVSPALKSLEQIYGNMDTIAEQTANGSNDAKLPDNKLESDFIHKLIN